MNKIEFELFNFCDETSFAKCLECLRNKLTKNSQIDDYDYIYDSFIDENNMENFNSKTIIPGLESKVKLMIFCRIYDYALFPGKILQREISDYRMNQIVQLLDMQFSFDSFISAGTLVSNLYNDASFFEDENALPKNRLCFPYILIHKAGQLSFTSMNRLLFENPNYTKIPLSLLILNSKNGPHKNIFSTSESFYYHDTEHLRIVLDNISKFDFEKIRRISKLYPKKTIKRSIIDIYIHTYVFERQYQIPKYFTKNSIYYEDENKNGIHYDGNDEDDVDEDDEDDEEVIENLDIFENFSEKFMDIHKIFEPNDAVYVFKYLLSSEDLNKDLSEFLQDYLAKKSMLDSNFSEVFEERNILKNKYPQTENDLKKLAKIEKKSKKHDEKLFALNLEMLENFYSYAREIESDISNEKN